MNLEKIMHKSLFVNLFLIVVKIVFGFLFNSIALIADGIHSVSDLMSDIFVILGIKHSIKPADEDHPIGHGKFEYILSLFLGLTIMLIAYNLGKTVILRFNEAVQIPSALSLIVVLVVVVTKFILARYLIDQGTKTDSSIIKASGKESLTDVFSSGVVFIGVISVLLGDYFNITFLLKGDEVASLIIALFIVRIGLQIIFDAIHSIQGKSVKDEICLEYKKKIINTKGVITVDHLEMIAYGPYYQALVDIRVDGNKTVKEGHDIAHHITENLLKEEKICHAIVHVNPEGGDKQ
ncbi:MAG: cation diffusion facilitator family transporter [Candidatus Izimaplasma sp.]|nr:cation diffusion facilitator family transporter [Candidatus Izimaplasma bacterium]